MQRIIHTLIVLGLAACASQDSVAPSATEAVEVRAAKGGANNPPGEKIEFADSVNIASAGEPAQWNPAGIRGDGRLSTGVASVGSPSNEYQSQYCGVEAYSNTSGSQTAGRLNIDPDIRWNSTMQSTCGGPRQFHFYLAGLDAPPTPRGPHSLADFDGLMPGQSANREMRFGVQMTDCAGIRFSDAYPPSVNARVTRLPDVILPNGAAMRQWKVESQGSHRGSCVVSTKRGFVGTGVSYYLPFAILVTEVPASSVVFP